MLSAKIVKSEWDQVTEIATRKKQKIYKIIKKWEQVGCSNIWA